MSALARKTRPIYTDNLMKYISVYGIGWVTDCTGSIGSVTRRSLEEARELYKPPSLTITYTFCASLPPSFQPNFRYPNN